MKHIWSIICQKSSIDSETQLLSLFEVIEEINVVVEKNLVPRENKINIPVQFQLVNYWIAEDSSKENILDTKVELIDSDNHVLNSFENTVLVKKGISRFRNITKIQGLIITKSGRYYLNVMLKNKATLKYEKVSELPIDIKIDYK